MKALITGASSGIGKDFAINLSNKGYDLVLVARDLKGLKEVQKLCKTEVEIVAMDLSIEQNCYDLYKAYNKVDILINNAGFGLFGAFDMVNLEKELNMIDLNIKAVHVLTKLYLKSMKKADNGYILNVASSAAFLPGPLMSTYYATKSYVFRITTAIYEELRKEKSNVTVSVLCPGPVDTNFNNVANVSFSVKSLTSKYVADYAVKKMFKNKLIIIPGITVKIGVFFSKFIPLKFLLKINYLIQKKKEK
ncbi:MAG: SDR family NAD(P)-dependent oxidoreductase [Bacilli bacterium]